MRKSTIGVIGAGLIGGTLARNLAALGHDVRVANSKSPDTLTTFEGVQNLTPTWATHAVHGADIVIVSVPESRIETLGHDLGPHLTEGTAIIDTGNYYPNRDGRIPALENGLNDSEWVSRMFGRPVIKVFNNIPAPSLKAKGTESGERRVGLAVAGTAGPAKETVYALVEQLGFEPVDGGTLEDSWRQQPGTPTYCRDLDPDSLRAGLADTKIAHIGDYHRSRDEMVDSTQPHADKPTP